MTSSKEKYLSIPEWQDQRITKEVHDSDRAHFRDNGGADFYRLMVRGEEVGYFPPMTAVHVMRDVFGTITREYYLPPRKYWEELEYRYNKMLPDEMVYHMQKDIMELAGLFHIELIMTADGQCDDPRYKDVYRETDDYDEDDVYADQQGSWEILDIVHRERDWWHKFDEGPTSVLPAGCIWRMPAPRLPEKRRVKMLVVGASRGKIPLESNGVGINSRGVHAESVVSAFQHPTYTTR